MSKQSRLSRLPKKLPLEIERKWLVARLPDLSRAPSTEILQGYLSVIGSSSEIRIRQRSKEFCLTIKNQGTLVRSEVEITISATQFHKLLKNTVGNRIRKTRYLLKHKGKTLELDLFRDQLIGLLLVEVEFSSVREAKSFKAPTWFGEEVTDLPAYRNRQLAEVAPWKV